MQRHISKGKSRRIKEFLWFILMIETLIILLATISGTNVGFALSLKWHIVLGGIIGLCLLIVFAGFLLADTFFKRFDSIE